MAPNTDSALHNEFAQQPDPMLRPGRTPWGWIIAGIVAVIVFVTLIYGMSPDGTGTATNPAANPNVPPATTGQAPATGSQPLRTAPSGTAEGTGTPTPPAATPGAPDVPPARPLDNAAPPPAGTLPPSPGTPPPQ
jgi:hypothetical protein